MATLFDGSKTELTVANLKANTRAFAHRAGQSSAEYLQIQTLAEYINGGAAVATIQGSMVGDDSTDNLAAWDSLISAYDHVIIPAGTYLFTGPMDIPKFKTVLGIGTGDLASSGTRLKGTSGQPAVVRMDQSLGLHARCVVGGFVITGASDAGLWTDDVTGSHIFDIELYGFTGAYGFDITNSFDDLIERLFVSNSTLSAADFRFSGYFNANVVNNIGTSTNSPINIHINGGSSNTYNGLICQGGDIGLYYQAGNGNTFEAMYQENVGVGAVLGVATTSLVSSSTFNSCSFATPGVSQAAYADRITCIDIQYAHGVTFNSPRFINVNLAGGIDFDTNGGGTGALGRARVHPDGNIHSIVLLRGGTGYSAGPFDVVITTAGGTGATATATSSGGVIDAVTLTAGGSGYTQSGVPCSIRYTNANRISVNAPYLNHGSGILSSFYPTVCRDTGANTTSGVNVHDAPTERHSSGGAMGNMRRTQGFAYSHYIEELDVSGTPVRWQYIPPELTT